MNTLIQTISKSLTTSIYFSYFLIALTFLSNSSIYAQGSRDNFAGTYNFKDHTAFKSTFRIYTSVDGIYVEKLSDDGNQLSSSNPVEVKKWKERVEKLAGSYTWDATEKRYKNRAMWVKYYNPHELGVGALDDSYPYRFVKVQKSLSSRVNSQNKDVSHLLGSWKIERNIGWIKIYAGEQNNLIVQDQVDFNIYELNPIQSVVEKYSGFSRNRNTKLLITVVSNQEIKLDLDGNVVSARRIGVAKGVNVVNTRQEYGIAAINEKDISGNTKLHRAAYNSKYEDVEELLDLDADINAKNKKGETALHKAVQNGTDAKLVTLLLDHNANIHTDDNSGKTPFELAINKWEPTNTSVVDAFIKKNPRITNQCIDIAFNRSSTNKDLIVTLVKAGGNSSYAAEKAVNKNSLQIFQAILDNAPQPIIIKDRMFDKAVDSRNYMMADVMISRGANPRHALTKSIASDVPDLVYMALEAGGEGTEALGYAVKKKDVALAAKAIGNHNANASKEFVNAVNSNHTPMVKLFIKDGGVTPTKGLSAAVSNRNKPMLIFLLDQGANANAAISQASGLGYDNLLLTMINAPYNGNPDLGIEAAAKNNHHSTVKILLNANADPNLLMPIAIEKAKDSWVDLSLQNGAKGDKPAYIRLASQNGNTTIVSKLLKAGASPDNGILPAAKNDHTHTLITLLNAGADPNPVMPIAIEKEKADWISLCLKKGAKGDNPKYINEACKKGNLAIVSMLLEAGASPDYGILSAIKGAFTGVVDKLVRAGADVKNPKLLTEAVRFNKTTLTKILLDAGANPEVGVSPAVSANAHLVLQQLIDAGANAAKPALLMQTVKRGYNNTATVLLNLGLNANAIDQTSGYYLIHFAAQSNNSGLIKILIKKGAEPNAATKDGKANTSLHLVAKQGKKFLGSATALIAAGANVNAKNAENHTVLKVAKTTKMKRLLRKAGAKKK